MNLSAPAKVGALFILVWLEVLEGWIPKTGAQSQKEGVLNTLLATQ